jgi:hypothetical protein
MTGMKIPAVCSYFVFLSQFFAPGYHELEHPLSMFRDIKGLHDVFFLFAVDVLWSGDWMAR